MARAVEHALAEREGPPSLLLQVNGNFEMAAELSILILTAISVGFIHTILGPDHYIPFVAMSKAGGWSLRKTVALTGLCGLGHVAGSVVIGAAGLAMGKLAMQLEPLESLRGSVASWLLIGFGLAYLTWGAVRAIRDRPHTHLHQHANGVVHTHRHVHDLHHLHVHPPQATSHKSETGPIAVWVVFIIFVFGPCEPLIPLLMYPAAQANAAAVAGVVGGFAVATIVTMTAAVVLIRCGLSAVYAHRIHRYSHALAGLAILVCGVLVKLGL